MENDSESMLKPDPTIDNKIEEQLRKIKSDIEKYRKNVVENEDILKGIQGKINNLYNLKHYKASSQDPDFLSNINLLVQKSISYGDRSTEEYRSSFPENCGSMVFESAIFQLLDSDENLEKTKRENNIKEKVKSKASDMPDYSFIDKANNTLHYIECVSKTSSRFLDFIKILPSFEHYYGAVMLVHKRFEEKKILHSYEEWKKWYHAEEHAIYNLTQEKRDAFISYMVAIKPTQSVCSLKKAIEVFSECTDIIRYAGFYYPFFIEQEVLDRLKKVDFPSGYFWDEKIDLKFTKILTAAIADALIEKMKKEYFKKGHPVTLAISFSLRKEFNVQDILTVGLVSYLQQHLKEYILDGLLKADFSNPKKTFSKSEYNCAIQNLYAIILDGTWYNWCPDIVTQRHGANFPDENRNCYLCIYNKNHPLVL
jgi:hypothetical protein